MGTPRVWVLHGLTLLPEEVIRVAKVGRSFLTTYPQMRVDARAFLLYSSRFI